MNLFAIQTSINKLHCVESEMKVDELSAVVEDVIFLQGFFTHLLRHSG